MRAALRVPFFLGVTSVSVRVTDRPFLIAGTVQHALRPLTVAPSADATLAPALRRARGSIEPTSSTVVSIGCHLRILETRGITR